MSDASFDLTSGEEFESPEDKAQRLLREALAAIAAEPRASKRRQMRKALGSKLSVEWRKAGCRKVGRDRRIAHAYMEETGQKITREVLRLLKRGKMPKGQADAPQT